MGKKKRNKNEPIKVPIKVMVNGVEQERFEGEIVTQTNIAVATEDYSKLFGANKNNYRVNPVGFDGLKPGKRRLLYSWWESLGCPKNTKPESLKKLVFKKVETIASNAMSYHPHGSSANEELIGREGQYWSNNVMLIEPHGSFGNLESSNPAAGRYIKATLSEYAIDCFFDDFDKYCVPMKLSYEGDKLEPEFLPAKYPHILFNPQFSGIGYGLASNIPPFNVTEVLESTIKLIKDPNAKILLIPDIPTGCDIIDEGNFEEINKTGQSKLTMRASYEIDYGENTIRFTSLPLQTKSSIVISKIIDLKKKKKMFDEISDIDDSTKNGEVDILIRLKSDANPDKVLEKLFKKGTGLKSTFPVGITVIDDYSPYDYGVRDLLLAWIEERRDLVRSMFLNSLQLLSEKQHMNEALLLAFADGNIDKSISISKNSRNKKECIEKLMKEYKITSLQATTLAEMYVYNFNQEYHEKYKDEKKKLQCELTKINDILEVDEKIDEFIISQLQEGIEKYGHPRKSRIIKVNDKDKKSIPNTEHLLGISENGYIKKISLKDNTSIGMVSRENSNLTVININNREDVLVVDSTGMVSKIPVSAVPNMEFDDIGVELSRYFHMSGKVIATLKLPSLNILDTDNDSLCVVFITKKGLAKKVPISNFKKITGCRPGILLNDGDELATTIFSFDNNSKDILVYTNFGDGIRLNVSDIKTAGRTAKGTKIIDLKDGEVVINSCKINPTKKLLFYVTSAGRVKLTELKYFPVMDKKSEAIPLLTLEGKETLVGVASVSKKDVVVVYKKTGEPTEIKLSDLEISTRISKAEKVVKVPKGDSIVGYKAFISK